MGMKLLLYGNKEKESLLNHTIHYNQTSGGVANTMIYYMWFNNVLQLIWLYVLLVLISRLRVIWKLLLLLKVILEILFLVEVVLMSKDFLQLGMLMIHTLLIII